MNFVVTGGAGFVGTNLIKRLLSDGHKVFSLDNYSTGKKENHIEDENVNYTEMDISNIDMYSDMPDNVDGVFHLAALARIQPSFDHPSLSFEANSLGTQSVMEWVRGLGCPLVYAGSSSTHGDKYANPYTFTKWLGEEVIKMYSKIYDVPTIITRFYNVYGEHQATEGAYCNVLGIFERLYTEGKPLTITGDGKQRRDFTYVGDIVDGIVKSMEAMHGAVDMRYEAEEIELGRGKNYSINDIAGAFGQFYSLEYIDAWPGEARETLNTDTKAKELLGWNPTVDIIEYIKDNYVAKNH
jgi:UDP-glucose 4-epimerase|tara:strand:+ start:185 stop:1075 length:891 start_codon:yes stop_codon:yes gene_type:complete